MKDIQCVITRIYSHVRGIYTVIHAVSTVFALLWPFDLNIDKTHYSIDNGYKKLVQSMAKKGHGPCDDSQ